MPREGFTNDDNRPKRPFQRPTTSQLQASRRAMRKAIARTKNLRTPVLEDGTIWYPMFIECPICQGTDRRNVNFPDFDTQCVDCGFTMTEEKPDILWDEEKLQRLMQRENQSLESLEVSVYWWGSLGHLDDCDTPEGAHPAVNRIQAHVLAGEMSQRVANYLLRVVKITVGESALWHTRQSEWRW